MPHFVRYPKAILPIRAFPDHPRRIGHGMRRKVAAMALSLALVLTAGGVAATQQAEYDRISGEMETIRGLELLEPLDISAQSREELRDWLLDTVEQDYPAAIQEQDLRILVTFGFVEPGTDLGAMQVDLLGEQVAGYYDPETGEMVVVSSGSGSGELSASDEVTFAHEVVHAIQDQHFDLLAIQEGFGSGSDDEYLAVTALIEGDASVAQVFYLLEHPGLLMQLQEELAGLNTEQLDTAPSYIAGTLIFPYDQGATFVTELYEEGGWDLVDEAYDNPPQSTEQILHPQKYLDREAPIDVSAVDPLPVLGDGWQILEVNTFGEYITNLFLDSGEIRPEDAETAAAGWGGDEYVLATNGDQTAVIWDTEWDSEADADEFFTILTTHERKRLNASEWEEADGTFTFTGDDMSGEIRIDGTRVTYVFASDDTVIADLMDNQVDGGDEAVAPGTPEATPIVRND